MECWSRPWLGTPSFCVHHASEYNSAADSGQQSCTKLSTVPQAQASSIIAYGAATELSLLSCMPWARQASGGRDMAEGKHTLAGGSYCWDWYGGMAACVLPPPPPSLPLPHHDPFGKGGVWKLCRGQFRLQLPMDDGERRRREMPNLPHVAVVSTTTKSSTAKMLIISFFFFFFWEMPKPHPSLFFSKPTKCRVQSLPY